MEQQQNGYVHWRLPLTLSISKTPLFIRIDCPPNFPVMKPKFIVLAKVNHPDIHPTSKEIHSPLIDQWNLH